MSFLDSRDALAASGIGKSVPRREDARLLTGKGRYAADFNLPGQVFAYVLRSPHAHAKIVAIDPAPATGAPGVLAVLTGSDAAADGIGAIPHSPVPANPHEVPLKNPDGSPFFIAPHPVLATDAVRYVGEPVAIVIAETLPQAMDAAERVQVRYETLPCANPLGGCACTRGAARLGAARLEPVRQL
jgi:aerobic carbon-monoxide dehydrogenase large subunit